MNYSSFVEIYEILSNTTKKLEKIYILSEFVKKLENHSEWIYLLRGRVFPEYDSREFGMSTQLVMKAIAKAAGVRLEKVSELYKKIGDLGDTAEELLDKKTQSSLFNKQLTVHKVFNNLRKIVSYIGKGAVEKKIDEVVELLSLAKKNEAKYIIRTILGDLRVGVADALLRDAIAKAFFLGDNKAAKIIEETYDLLNDFAEIFELAKKRNLDLMRANVVPGRPIKVMLPVKVTDLDEAFRICGKRVAVEHKYDGFRVIISFDGKEIKLFTRKFDEITTQFPDIVSLVKKNIHGRSFILDSEVVGYDPQKKKYKPFEAISQRIKRKYNVDKLIKKLPVEVNIFDIIYYDGKSLLEMPFYERRALLEKIIQPIKWQIKLSTQFVTEDKKAVEKFYKDALLQGEEGIMIKRLDAPYRPGRFVGYMVKMKPESADLDLVIVGAEYGTGKRAGGLTSFIVACRNGEKEFLEVGKVSSGLKEKIGEGTSYKEINDLLEPLIIKKTANGVIVKPKVVVSVSYQNIQISPTYDSGFALRFPKITHYRPERGIHDISTIEDIKREFSRTRKLRKKDIG